MDAAALPELFCSANQTLPWLRTVLWAYPLLTFSLMPVWVSSLFGSIPLKRIALKPMSGSLAWLLFFCTALAITCLEPFKHIALFAFARKLPVRSGEPGCHAKLWGSDWNGSDFILDPDSRGANIKCLARMAQRFAGESTGPEGSVMMAIGQRPATSLPEPFDDIVPIPVAAQLRLRPSGQVVARTVTPEVSMTVGTSQWHYRSAVRTGMFGGALNERLRQFGEH